MSQPYQAVDQDAREDIVRRKVFHERKVKEYAEVLATMDSLDSYFREHPFPEDSPVENTEKPSDEERAALSPVQHRRKETLYDEEMLKLLARVKVASKAAVYQHFHDVFRGNTSIGAVESYLKRAVLRGTIMRLRRGEYTLPPQTH